MIMWNVTIIASDRSYVQDYIQTHKALAVAEMHRTGIPASIKLAQGMLESNWGRSELARKANNHFGIKCGGAWKGETFYREDDDRNKRGKIIPSCFRAFDSVTESYIAHSEFLTDPKKEYRYGHLFKLDITDYKGWAKGLRKSGYATDKKYPKKLIQLIEKYDLHQYDKQPMGYKSKEDSLRMVVSMDEMNVVRRGNGQMDRETKPEVKPEKLKLESGKLNGIKVVYANGTASIEEIAASLKKKPEYLLKYNELFQETSHVPAKGIPVFVYRKKSAYTGKNRHHVVVEGETMASIAHHYGMRLQSLYIKNRMPKGSEPIVGERLNLHRSVSKRKAPKYTMKVLGDAQEELLFLDDDTLK